MDACPGRMNTVQLLIKRQGVFYGQCSEICGVNHGFMPIVVEGLTAREFEDWSSAKYAFRGSIKK
jgi:heme/copper-type cytochrome/quinol oxidase subunit 2